MSRRKESSAERKKAVTKSAKAGLQFPIGRLGRYLKKGRYVQCVGSGAPMYLVAVLEYLAAEVLELARNVSKDNKKHRIIPCHIQLAIKNNEDVRQLLSGVTIAYKGVLSNIHSVLVFFSDFSSLSPRQLKFERFFCLEQVNLLKQMPVHSKNE